MSAGLTVHRAKKGDGSWCGAIITTYSHETVLRLPARRLGLIALRRDAAHVDEAKGRGVGTATLAVGFEDGSQAEERILLTHAAHFCKVDPRLFARGDGNGPRFLRNQLGVREGMRELLWGAPDTGVRTGELLDHIVRVAAVVGKDGAVEFGNVGGWAKVRGRGHGAAGEGDYGCDFGDTEALTDDFGGDKAGGTGDDKLHDGTELFTYFT